MQRVNSSNKKYNLISRKNYRLSNGLILHIPSIKEYRGGNDSDEKKYKSLTTPFITTSTNYMLELFDMGINFEDLENDWEFFLLQMTANRNELKEDYSLIFENIKECCFKVVSYDDSIFVYDEINDIKITEDIFYEMSDILCQIFFIEKEHRKFANQRSREKKISMLRKKRERNLEDNFDLDSLILFAVNNSNFKYDFETVNNLTIYEFLASIRQITRDEQIDNLKFGGYTGNIDLSKMSPNELDKLKTLTK